LDFTLDPLAEGHGAVDAAKKMAEKYLSPEGIE
jgi:hypothetical protein